MERVWLSLRNHVRLCQGLGLHLTRACLLVCLLSSFSWTEKFVGENGSQCPFPSKLVQSTQKCEHQWTQGLSTMGFYEITVWNPLHRFAGKCLFFPDPPSLPSPRLAQSEAGVNCEYYWIESWKYFYWCANNFPKTSQGLFFSMTFTVLLDVVPCLPQASPSGFLRRHLPASRWEFLLFSDLDPLASFEQACGFPAYRCGMLLPLLSNWNPTGSSNPNFGHPHSEYSFLTSLSNQKPKDITASLAVKKLRLPLYNRYDY